MAANEEQRRRMLAMLLRIPPKNALQQAAPKPSNWLSKPLPMEGRFGLLPIKEEVPGMGPSLFNRREPALPGLLAGAVNAFTAPGRAANAQPGFDAKQEGAEFGLNFMGGGLLGSRMAQAPRGSVGMNVFHGSPHKFDKFDMSRIGSGEGNQAFGHGLYFAENPKVARDYTFVDAKIDPEVVTYNGKSLEDLYTAAQRKQDQAHRSNNQGLISQANAELGFWESLMTRNHPEQVIKDSIDPASGWPEMAAFARSIDLKKFGGVEKPGNFYHADIPDEVVGKMLDFDKTWQDQAPAVKEALRAAGVIDRFKANLSDFSTPQNTRGKGRGENIYAFLAREMGSEKKASEYLNSIGVTGMRYLDAGSRDKRRGTRNIVLFDDKHVKMLKRE
jgi:hypothetical protein